ncbi:MAG: tRNA uridine-5-carboxymethylaminomethyl(34) synthesis GTPase MnmE, partial [Candidatus Omnitrophica bacterium]|nr:tRNA uridine-5-carboxymethylaminomethyl(34) synthesis GTPase MnmE [Candidatus Omnitrophota bacterium]
AKSVLERCLANGARLAEPGEFTRRAFLNGRIDLAQAEAVLDMVSARTELMLKAANHQLKGDLSREIYSLREMLTTAYAGIEALLNFPEDDADRGQLSLACGEIRQACKRIEILLQTARSGVLLREGVRMVICGKPNVGKSSLLNALLKNERAIVTDVAGTTRDTLEESFNLKGLPVNLVDTAGILEPRDKVEAQAVRRSHEAIASADIAIVVLDRSAALEATDRELLSRELPAGSVIVLNKSDLPAALNVPDVLALAPGLKTVAVSALKRDGMAQLETVLMENVLRGGSLDTNGVVLTNVRHVEALRQAAQALNAALEALDNNAPGEIVSDGIKSAVNRLDAVTGRDIDLDALDRIFSMFCIGK